MTEKSVWGARGLIPGHGLDCSATFCDYTFVRPRAEPGSLVRLSPCGYILPGRMLLQLGLAFGPFALNLVGMPPWRHYHKHK